MGEGNLTRTRNTGILLVSRPEVKRPNFANLALFISSLKGCHGQPCFQNTASAIEKDVSDYTEALPTMLNWSDTSSRHKA
jgi:hypothetical protein